MTELIIDISNRKIINMNELKEFFNKMKDGKHLLTEKDYRKRSLPQNAYYWAVMVPLVRRGLYDAGYDEVRTDDDAHEVIKHVHLRKRIVSKQTGDVIDIAGRTSKLTIPEFNQFIEAVCKWSAEFLNVVIPSPHEQLVEFERWEEKLEETF
jgi:hypothetical protein